MSLLAHMLIRQRGCMFPPSSPSLLLLSCWLESRHWYGWMASSIRGPLSDARNRSHMWRSSEREGAWIPHTLDIMTPLDWFLLYFFYVRGRHTPLFCKPWLFWCLLLLTAESNLNNVPLDSDSFLKTIIKWQKISAISTYAVIHRWYHATDLVLIGGKLLTTLFSRG